jgi:hypothetical protein
MCASERCVLKMAVGERSLYPPVVSVRDTIRDTTTLNILKTHKITSIRLQ